MDKNLICYFILYFLMKSETFYFDLFIDHCLLLIFFIKIILEFLY